MNPALPVAWAYARLSREDVQRSGLAEGEALALRVEICRRIADARGLRLPAEHIIAEVGGGGKLSTRPGMLRLLDLARGGHVAHLVTPDVDRLLRGDKRDEQDIEDAFCDARTRVYLADGSVIPFGPDYDPLMFEIRALGARMELRKYAQRRRNTDREKLDQGKRTRGYAPYGYRWDKAAGTHAVVEEEWPTLREVWRRLLAGEGGPAIADALNARGVPAPALTRRRNAHPLWTPSAVYSIARNPIYAGHLAQRGRVERSRRRVFKADEYVISAAPGAWPTAITLDEWWHVQRLLSSRRGGPRPGTGADASAGPHIGLLTGILHGSCGRPMRLIDGETYSCYCGRKYDNAAGSAPAAHPGRRVGAPKFEDWARRVVSAVIAALPASLLSAPPPPRQDEDATRARLMACRRELADARRQAADMMTRRDEYVGLFGADTYRQTAQRVGASVERLAAEEAELQDALERPDLSEVLPLLARVRGEAGPGLSEFWGTAPAATQRQVIAAVLRRIELPATAQGERHTAATPVPWDWCARHLPGPDRLPELTAFWRPKGRGTGPRGARRPHP